MPERKIIKQLEITVDNLNKKLTKLKSELIKLKEENLKIKESNYNQTYINDRLNKAMTKLMDEKKRGVLK